MHEVDKYDTKNDVRLLGVSVDDREPEQQQPQPPPPETNPPISSTKLEDIIAHRIIAALANVTRGGVRNEGNSFHGTKGVVRLTRWIEKKESIFQISFCPNECKTLTMKGSEINAYTTRFNDLAVMCPALVTQSIRRSSNISGV
uniref:Reverse transcriptase domain-containing protein n=1 Tax=Lactuca sativa TaxID=4236 RepID=A0A9R1UIH3_LACSA|nr:hypothetical protein LSAT_V11C900489870 [Lactuca sativa]